MMQFIREQLFVLALALLETIIKLTENLYDVGYAH